MSDLLPKRVPALVLAAALAGCSAVGYPSPTPPPPAAPARAGPGTPAAGLEPGEVPDIRAEPLSDRGNPPTYEVFGRTYRTRPVPDGFEQEGLASWYGDEFAGRPTSSGELFDPDLLTAAHRTIPLPSWVKVTNLENGRTVVVRVNDRGPFADPDHRIIDLSEAAARELGMIAAGVARVRLKVLVGPIGFESAGEG